MVQEELQNKQEEIGDVQDVLGFINSSAHQTISLCNIISKIDIEMYEAMEERITANEIRVKELTKVKEDLLAQLDS